MTFNALHLPISYKERLKVMKDYPLASIRCAPGHTELRCPPAVLSIGKAVSSGQTFKSEKDEPILLNVYTSVDNSKQVKVDGVECLDGNHRLAGCLTTANDATIARLWR